MLVIWFNVSIALFDVIGVVNDCCGYLLLFTFAYFEEEEDGPLVRFPIVSSELQVKLTWKFLVFVIVG